MRFTKKTASAILGTIIGLGLSLLLLRAAGGSGGISAAIGNILDRLSSAQLGTLLAAFAFFLVSQVLRAIRWMVLSFGKKVTFSISMPVTSIHVGLGHILPVRLSDFAFVGLLRHFGAVPVGYGTATVVFAKLLDLVAMGVVIGSAVALGVGEMALVAPAIAALGFLGILFIKPLLGVARKPVCWILGRISAEGKIHWFDDLLEASSLSGRKGRLALAFIVSIIAWISKLMMFSMLLSSLGITGIPIWKIFFASGVTDLAMALPIHGVLSMGTVEAGWAAGFAMVGVGGVVAAGANIIELGFSVHALWMLMAITLMIVAIPILWMSSRRRSMGTTDLESGGENG